jgi:two-component system sensor histidine kinase EvgS
VTVHDTGRGMTAELAAALTDADAPPVRTASGTGLGLAIARNVAASWGGELHVDSGGKGTAVTIRIPWMQETEPAGVEPTGWTESSLSALITVPPLTAVTADGRAPTNGRHRGAQR